MNQNTNNYLAEERIGKLLLKFSIPCIMSLLVSSLYNIVDQIFIGRGVGYLGNGATNVVFPITVISLAIALMLGDDGKGYPNGLSGNDIPEVARIIAVADSFDAMYSDRQYRKQMDFEKVLSIIREVSGTQLNPEVVDAFFRLVDKGEIRAVEAREPAGNESLSD